ncbi:MAG: sulfatase [Verrucomicrobia bacterium]|nr:sulfatase [Verrucomicrobiota bacterium]MDA1068698.1 sulfatase [Verrucomicrobiota bacterium]
MKAIMVMFDTLNRHFLPNYGCDWTHAPNFKRLSERTVTFENAWVGSMPCMPARRDMHTGRLAFTHRSWGPIEPFDDSLPEILKNNGIHTHLVTDHYHYFEEGGGNYHTRYSSWEFNRGQEWDPWKGEVKDPELPEIRPGLERQKNRQNWVNRKHMDTPEKQSIAKTFDQGLEFIRTNREEDNWFLQIETFDPHEPYFTHDKHKSLYPHDYDGAHIDWPEYRPVNETDRDAIEHVRYQYAADLSLCDEHLGRVLDQMDELDLWDDTMLIVCTDHGFLLSEHDWWGKNRMPLYNEIAHIPLFIWDPRCGKKDERRKSIVQFIDFAPTLLDLFGLDPTPDMMGQSLAGILETDTPNRDTALFGLFGGHVNITDGRWVYMRGPVTTDNTPLYQYTLMPTHLPHTFNVEELQDIQLQEPFPFTKGCRTMKIASGPVHQSIQHEFGTLLFDLESDYGQLTPVTDTTAEERMTNLLIREMKHLDAPPDQFERLGLDVSRSSTTSST